MRARNLKPSIFSNEQLAHLGSDHFRLFTGLWCVADRKGRLEDRPEQIEAKIFPFKWQKVDVNKMLDDLANSPERFIVRYERDGQRYIEVSNFLDHQYPHLREAESTIPAPEKHSASTRRAHLNPESLSSESPILNPDIPLPPKGAFEILWAKYPRREGKKAAEKHFKASVQTHQDWLDIQNALDNYLSQLRSNRTELQFTKMGSTWFNNWRDYVNYKVIASTIVKAPIALPKPRVIEKEPDLTESDLREMHDQKVTRLGACTVQDCSYCVKVAELTIAGEAKP